MYRGGVPEPLMPPSSEAAPELVAVDARVCAEWGADEDLWMREAARRWAHARRLVDLLREFADRGDHVAIDVGGSTFTGEVGAIGDDRVDVVTPVTVVTVHTALSGSFGAIAAPLVIRRSRRARAGGRRIPMALAGFVARLRELEEAGEVVRVGTFLAGSELTGRIVVGVDHVAVRGDDEVVVPTAWTAYVAAISGVGA